jgi:hypothetical protein
MYHLVSILPGVGSTREPLLLNITVRGSDLLGVHKDRFLLALGVATDAAHKQHCQDPEHAQKYAYPAACHWEHR